MADAMVDDHGAAAVAAPPLSLLLLLFFWMLDRSRASACENETLPSYVTRVAEIVSLLMVVAIV